LRVVSFSVFLVDRFDFKSYGDIIENGIKMFNDPLDGITASYLARRNAIHFSKETDSLYEVAVHLSRPECHRVPILNAAGHIVNIISQSSIISFLDKHKAKLDSLELEEKVGEHGSAPVMTIQETATAYEAFKLMDVKHRSAVAVIDREGKLLSCTSCADLKLFAAKPRSSSLKLSIMDFLSDVRSTQIDIKSPTIVCQPDSSLGHCIGKISATHVHRLFVTDGHHRALRVLSITDVLRWILG